MKRIRSIARALWGIVALLAAAFRATLRQRRRSSAARPAAAVARTGPSPAREPADGTAEHPLEPYPEEITVAGQLIDLPQPSAWPMILAFGVTLLFFGLVTNLGISAVGLLVILSAVGGWISELRHA